MEGEGDATISQRNSTQPKDGVICCFNDQHSKKLTIIGISRWHGDIKLVPEEFQVYQAQTNMKLPLELFSDTIL